MLYSFVAFYCLEKKGKKAAPSFSSCHFTAKQILSSLSQKQPWLSIICGDWLWLSVSPTAVLLWRWKFHGLPDEKEERGEIWFHWQLPYPSSLRWAVDTARPFWTSGRKTNRAALSLGSSYCCLSSVIWVVIAEGGGCSCREPSGHCVTEVKLKEIAFSIRCKSSLYTSSLACDRQQLILSGRVPENHSGYWKTVWDQSPVCVCARTHVGESCVTPHSQSRTWLRVYVGGMDLGTEGWRRGGEMQWEAGSRREDPVLIRGFWKWVDQYSVPQLSRSELSSCRSVYWKEATKRILVFLTIQHFKWQPAVRVSLLFWDSFVSESSLSHPVGCSNDGSNYCISSPCHMPHSLASCIFQCLWSLKESFEDRYHHL